SKHAPNKNQYFLFLIVPSFLSFCSSNGTPDTPTNLTLSSATSIHVSLEFYLSIFILSQLSRLLFLLFLFGEKIVLDSWESLDL
ncbi:hypothetical protein, partial [Enterococcus lactis]|uniref:hypothetical protein n=1 Tax=Enterococcus lactis TaxID=357441 RepID=UPI00237A3D3F